MSQIRVAICFGVMVLACTSSGAQQDQQERPIEDKDVVVTSFEEMRYPAIARISRIQGVVVVRVRLDTAGKVISADAISGSKMLIPEAITNVRKWQFRPNATKSAVIIYEFRISEGICDPAKGMGLLFVFREPNIASITGCIGPPQP